MCRYWKKLHTCTHTSDRPYIEMCRSGCLSNTVCSNIAEDADPRPSHFPCWVCIRTEARADLEAAALAEQKAIAKDQEARQRAAKEKQVADAKAKEEKIRQVARERAAKEREDELRTKREKDEQERRAKKEGGLWIETGSGKKGKGKKNGFYNGPPTPTSGPPTPAMIVSRDQKENDNGKMSPDKESGNGYQSPKKDKRISQGGRAGTWGPPKKILSRADKGGGA